MISLTFVGVLILSGVSWKDAKIVYSRFSVMPQREKMHLLGLIWSYSVVSASTIFLRYYETVLYS